MTVQYVDPRGEPAAAAEPYELADELADGAVIGLMANGFPDSVAFLDQVEAALQVAVPGATFRRYDKGNASALATDELLDTIAAECRTVVAAYGHWGSCTSGTVRDGIEIARRGRPAVALVTDEFWEQGDFVARSAGMPDVPRVRLPHPVAGTGESAMRKVAAEVAPTITAALRGAG